MSAASTSTFTWRLSDDEETAVRFQEPSVHIATNAFDKGHVIIKWDKGRKCRQNFSQPQERSNFRLYNQSKINVWL